jgi:hypothetical protein
MRCISPHRNYSIQVIEAEEQILVDARGFAKTLVLKKPVIANFQQSGMLDHEEYAALERFNFSGLPENVNPLSTVSVLDIEAEVQKFPADRRNEIYVQYCKRMTDLQARFPSEFIIVPSPQQAKPWPSYDEFNVEDVLKFQDILRIAPDDIRLYELENADRPEVVIAMLKITDPAAAVRYQRKLDGVDVEAEEEKASPAPGLDSSKLREALGDLGDVVVDA